MARLFISYTHSDEALKDRLIAHLAALKHEGLVEIWHDRMLRAGEHLDPAIQAELAGADLVLLLVSADFINSRYCYEEEMLRAFERQRRGEAKVAAIILRPCNWKFVPLGGGQKLGDFLSLPKDGKAVTSWPDVEEAVDNVVGEIRRLLLSQPAAESATWPPAGAIATAPDPTTWPPAMAAPQPNSASVAPRLRLAGAVTDQDRDRFLRDGFNQTSSLFRARLSELEAANPGLGTDFERVDTRTFIARIYAHGKDVGGAKLFYGGDFMSRAICLSFETTVGRNSMNEWAAVEVDRDGLCFKPGNMSSLMGRPKERLDEVGVADFFWDVLFRHMEARLR